MTKPKLTKEEKRKLAGEKWLERSERYTAAGKGMQQAGGKMAGCGCLLTLLITIPIIIIIVFLFL